MKRLLAIFAITLFAATPSLAAGDWSKYKSLSNVQCESPTTIADIAASAKGFKVYRFATDVTVLNSKTVQARDNLLECKVNLSVTLKDKRIITGGHFVVYFDRGWATVSFDPSYEQTAR
jgi:hypothetical protein